MFQPTTERLMLLVLSFFFGAVLTFELRPSVPSRDPDTVTHFGPNICHESDVVGCGKWQGIIIIIASPLHSN